MAGMEQNLFAFHELAAFLPNRVVRCVVDGGDREAQISGRPLVEEFYASVLMVDITGFTPLCNRIAKEGRRAGETISHHVSSYFSKLIDVIEGYGGDIYKFVGDAIIVTFAALESPSRSGSLVVANGKGSTFKTPSPRSMRRNPIKVLNNLLGQIDWGKNVRRRTMARATCVELAMRCALHLTNKDLEYKEDDVHLKLHAGVGAGLLKGYYLGGMCEGKDSDNEPKGYQKREYILTGPVFSQLDRVLSISKYGEAVVSEEAFCAYMAHQLALGQLAKPKFEVRRVPSSKYVDIHLLRCLGATRLHLSRRLSTMENSQFIDLSDINSGRIAPYLPMAVLASESTGFLAELRRVTVAFFTLVGGVFSFNRESIDIEETTRLHMIDMVFKRAQEVVSDHGGCVHQFLMDDKGVILIALFGVKHYARGDDSKWALRAVLQVVRTIERLPAEVACCAGLTTGTIFNGIVGSEKRKQYDVLGPTVNLAARLMSLAKDTSQPRRRSSVGKENSMQSSKGRSDTSIVSVFCDEKTARPFLAKAYDNSHRKIFSGIRVVPFEKLNSSDKKVLVKGFDALPKIYAASIPDTTIDGPNDETTPVNFIWSTGRKKQLLAFKETIHRAVTAYRLNIADALWDCPSFILLTGAFGDGRRNLLDIALLRARLAHPQMKVISTSLTRLDRTTPYRAIRSLLVDVFNVKNVHRNSRMSAILSWLKNAPSMNGKPLHKYAPLLEDVFSDGLTFDETPFIAKMSPKQRGTIARDLLVHIISYHYRVVVPASHKKRRKGARKKLRSVAQSSSKKRTLGGSTRKVLGHTGKRLGDPIRKSSGVMRKGSSSNHTGEGFMSYRRSEEALSEQSGGGSTLQLSSSRARSRKSSERYRSFTSDRSSETSDEGDVGGAAGRTSVFTLYALVRLQFADAASLSVLYELLDKGCPGLMVVACGSNLIPTQEIEVIGNTTPRYYSSEKVRGAAAFLAEKQEEGAEAQHTSPQGTLRRISCHSRVMLVYLPPLTQEQTHRFIFRCLNAQEIPEGLSERIYTRTNGSPMLIHQLLTVLQNSRKIIVNRHACVLGFKVTLEDLNVSNSLRLFLISWFDSLTAPCQLLLKVASVIGESFPIQLLVDLYGDARSLSVSSIRTSGTPIVRDRSVSLGNLDEEQKRRETEARVVKLCRFLISCSILAYDGADEDSILSLNGTTQMVQSSSVYTRTRMRNGAMDEKTNSLTLRFVHEDMRELAYNLLLTTQQIDLHLAIADWFESGQGNRQLKNQQWPRLAYHYGQAIEMFGFKFKDPGLRKKRESMHDSEEDVTLKATSVERQRRQKKNRKWPDGFDARVSTAIMKLAYTLILQAERAVRTFVIEEARMIFQDGLSLTSKARLPQYATVFPEEHLKQLDIYELRLQLCYGSFCMSVHGYGHSTTASAFRRANELMDKPHVSDSKSAWLGYRAMWGLWKSMQVRCDPAAPEMAERLMLHSRRMPKPHGTAAYYEALHAGWTSAFFNGKFRAALHCIDEARDLYRERFRKHAIHYTGHYGHVCCQYFRIATLGFLSRPLEAMELVVPTIEMAHDADHQLTLVQCYAFIAIFYIISEQYDSAIELAVLAGKIAVERELSQWIPLSRVLEHTAKCCSNEFPHVQAELKRVNLELLERAVVAALKMATTSFNSFVLAMAIRARIATGDPMGGIAFITGAMKSKHWVEAPFFLPLLHSAMAKLYELASESFPLESKDFDTHDMMAREYHTRARAGCSKSSTPLYWSTIRKNYQLYYQASQRRGYLASRDLEETHNSTSGSSVEWDQHLSSSEVAVSSLGFVSASSNRSIHPTKRTIASSLDDDGGEDEDGDECSLPSSTKMPELDLSSVLPRTSTMDSALSMSSACESDTDEADLGVSRKRSVALDMARSKSLDETRNLHGNTTPHQQSPHSSRRRHGSYDGSEEEEDDQVDHSGDAVLTSLGFKEAKSPTNPLGFKDAPDPDGVLQFTSSSESECACSAIMDGDA